MPQLQHKYLNLIYSLAQKGILISHLLCIYDKSFMKSSNIFKYFIIN